MKQGWLTVSTFVFLQKTVCVHHGESLRAGEEQSTCEQDCVCHSAAHMSCQNVSSGELEERNFIWRVQSFQPKTKVPQFSVEGTQYIIFDGQEFGLMVSPPLT